MPIGLTAKIEPKNDGFVGMVDADQVIGASGNGGYLPSSTISANSIQEYQLEVSNGPSDGYYLQYKDSTDKLTWAEITAGDSSGSTALEWLENSGQAYNNAYLFSSTSDIFDRSLYMLSSNIISNYYPSTLGNSLNTNYTNFSSNVTNLYYSSSLGNTLNTNYTNHAANESNPHAVNSSQIGIDNLDDIADGSTWVKSHNDYTDTEQTKVGYITVTQSVDLDEIEGNSSSGQSAKEWLDTSGSKYNQAYLHSSNSRNLFYPSGLGNTLNSSYIGHSSNTNNPHQVVWSDVSTAAKNDLDDEYYPSGLGNSLNNSYTNFSSNTANLFHPSAQGDFPYISTQTLSSNTIITDNVLFNEIAVGDSTYNSLRQWWRYGNSAGLISGGTIHSGANIGSVITFNISGGSGLLRNVDNDFAELYSVTWAPSTNIQVTKGDIKYVGVKWNGGSPVAYAQDTYTYDFDTNFPIGIVANRSGVACVANVPWKVNDYLTNIIERFDGMGWVTRDEHQGGLILGDTGTRNITLSAGKLWTRLNEHDISAIDTSAGDTFVQFIRKSPSVYTVYSESMTQWLNNEYDNSDGTFGTVGNNNYGVQWFYLLSNGTLCCVLGDQEYNTAAAAELATTPSTLPVCIEENGILIGRLIFEGTHDTAEEIQSAFDVTFTAAAAADHGNLTGLSDDDHSQYHNDTRGDIRYYTKTQSVNNFYPSNLGNTLNTNYIGHSSNSNIHIDWTDTTDNLKTTGSISGGSLSTEQYIRHQGDSNTYIKFDSDRITEIVSGNYAKIIYYSPTHDVVVSQYSSGGPERGAIHKFGGRDDEAYSLYIDAKTGGNPKVGIYTESPSYRLHVNGDFYANVISGGSIQESLVTQHSGSLHITESQITDLDHYTDSNVDSHLVGGTGITYNAGNISVTNHSQIVGNASSGQEAKEWLDSSGSKYNDAYDERGSQIAGTNLTWNGSQLDASLTGADTSSQVTLTDGIESTTTYLWHDGPAATLGLSDVPQSVLKSGSQYYTGYTHSTLTNNPHSIDSSDVGLENAMNSGHSWFEGRYYPSGLGNSLNTNYTNFSSNTSNLYYPSALGNTVTSDLSSHISDTSTHGITSTIVGTTESQTLTNKTLTTPTIGDFTNATHDHSDGSNGGTISYNDLTDKPSVAGTTYPSGHNYAYDYYIYKDASNYYVQAGVSGQTSSNYTDLKDCFTYIYTKETDGFNILLGTGTFETGSQIGLSSNVILHGLNKNNSIIKVKSTFNNSNVLYSRHTNGVTISNLTVDGNDTNNSNTYQCIQLQDISSCSLLDVNVIDVTAYGVNINESKFAYIDNLYISGSNNSALPVGLNIIEPSSMTANNITIYGLKYGIGLSRARYSNFSNIHIHGAYAVGMKVDGDESSNFACNSNFSNLLFENCIKQDGDSDCALKLDEQFNCTYNNINIINCSGLAGIRCYGNVDSVQLSNISISGVSRWGVAIGSESITPSNIVLNNTNITKVENTSGIYYGGIIANGTNHIISDCRINNSYRGIILKGDDIRVDNSIVTDSSSYGLYIHGSPDRCNITNSLFKDCSYGCYVYMDGGYYNTISNCTFYSNNSDGLYINPTFGLNIENCKFIENTGKGMYIKNNLTKDMWIKNCYFSGNSISDIDVEPITNTSSINIFNNELNNSLTGTGVPNCNIKYNQGYTTENCGFASVGNTDTIAHGCDITPKVTLTPSGNTPVAYSFTVDSTNITVYHTSRDNVTFCWKAEV